MAKYDVTQSCGHEVEHELFGPSADRQKRIAWLETVPCLACKRAAELAEAQAANVGLPTLTGSEKQIAWAEKIRAEKLAQIAAWMQEAEAAQIAAGNTPEFVAQDRAEAEKFIVRISAETSASWWIDHRGDAGSTIVKKLYQEAHRAQ